VETGCRGGEGPPGAVVQSPRKEDLINAGNLTGSRSVTTKATLIILNNFMYAWIKPLEEDTPWSLYEFNSINIPQ
jgi:hypothetical protein